MHAKVLCSLTLYDSIVSKSITYSSIYQKLPAFFPKVSVPVSVLIYRTYYINKKKEQMFEKLLHICYLKTIIKARNFEHVFLQSGGNIMENEKYKRLIIEMVQNVSDKNLLIRIYTYIKHLIK